MTLDDFVRENGDELRKLISRSLNFVPRTASCDCPKSGTDHHHKHHREMHDDDLKLWINNDEGLYNWARSSGVDFHEGDE